MSEEDRSNTSVLLPRAAIELFSNDKETVEVFESLTEDWRFARVTLTAMDGDVEAAVSRYESYESPDLVIIQTDTIDDSFTGRLEALAANCAEGTAAMIIGPVNDVNLYRKLVGMGVSDYLVRPLKAKAFSENIAATLLEKIGASGSCLIALVGAKGGVGTTMLAETLAWGVSEKLGQKTFLLDAAGGWSSLPVGMDFEPTTTLREAGKAAVEENDENLARMIFRPSEKLTVLASGGDVMLEDVVTEEEYETLLNHMMTTYPVMIVDLSQATADLKRVVLSKANSILVVTTPILPSVRAARTLLQEIKQLRGNDEKASEIILNMSGFAGKADVPKVQIEQGLERKIEHVFPFEPALFVGAESQAEKLTVHKGAEKIVAGLLASVANVLNVPEAAKNNAAAGGAAKDDKGGLGGILSRLKSK